jgi:hypothetical protein
MADDYRASAGEHATVPGPDAAGSHAADDWPADTRARVENLRDLARLLDSAVRVPGTNFRVGLDPILGLLPVAGDAPAALLSAYVVAEAAVLGVPRATLVRMLATLLVDAVVGSLPVVGDAFDAVWKANDRNVRLLEARLDDPAGSRRDGRVVAALAVGLFVALLALGAGATLGALWLLGRAGLVGIGPA